MGISIDDRNTLSLFCEKISELEKSGFVSQFKARKVSATITFGNSADITVRSGPDEEVMKALLLTLRMLGQNNDSISTRKVSKIFEHHSVSSEHRELFQKFWKELNDYLDTKNQQIEFTLNGKSYTRRDIFETFLYGEYAHTKDAHRSTLDAWKKTGVYNYKRFDFDVIVYEYLRRLHNMRVLGKKVLEADAEIPR